MRYFESFDLNIINKVQIYIVILLNVFIILVVGFIFTKI